MYHICAINQQLNMNWKYSCYRLFLVQVSLPNFKMLKPWAIENVHEIPFLLITERGPCTREGLGTFLQQFCLFVKEKKNNYLSILLNTMKLSSPK